MGETNSTEVYDSFAERLRESALRERDVIVAVEDEVSGFIPGRGVNVNRTYNFDGSNHRVVGLNYDNETKYRDERIGDVSSVIESMLSPYDIFDVVVRYKSENNAEVSVSMGDEFRDLI